MRNQLLVLALLTFAFQFQSNAQNFTCDQFNKGETTNIETYNIIADVSKAQSLVSFYRNLKWEINNEGSTKTLKLINNNPPKVSSGNPVFSRPVATSELTQKNFPKSFFDDFRACAGPYASTNYIIGAKPPPSNKGDYEAFAEKEHKKYERTANACERAITAIRSFQQRSDNLRRDMAAYCSNIKTPTANATSNSQTQEASSASVNNSRSQTAKSSNSTNSYSQESNTVSYSEATSQQRSVESRQQAEYNSWKTEQNRQIQQFNRDFEAIRQQGIRTRQAKQQMVNQALNRFANVLNQIADQRERERERKEQAKLKNEFRRAFDNSLRPFENYLNLNRTWEKRLSTWFSKYGYSLDYKIKSKVQKDLNELRDGAKKAYDNIDKLYDFRNEAAEDLDIAASFMEGRGNGLWSDFGGKYGLGRITSAIYDLTSYLNKSDTPANRLMVADYAKIAYDYEIQVKKSERGAYFHAKTITKYFSDYPGSGSMRALIEREDKRVAEERSRALIRKSLEDLPLLAKKGDKDGLNALVDSLIRFGNKDIIGNALTKNRRPSEMYILITKGGHYDAYIRLSKWLGNGYMGSKYVRNRGYTNEESAYLNGVAQYVTGNKNNRFLSQRIRSTSFYKNQVSQANYTFQALLDPTPEKIKKALSAQKSAYQYKGMYGIKSKRVSARWYHFALAFRIDNFKYIANEGYAYHGIWVEAINNNSQLKVVKVDLNSPAFQNNVEEGDIILRVNGRSASSIVESPAKPIDFTGFGSNYESPSSIRLEIKKKDGRVLLKSFPIKITSKNIKAGFAGSENLMRKEEPIPKENGSNDSGTIDSGNFNSKVSSRSFTTEETLVAGSPDQIQTIKDGIEEVAKNFDRAPIQVVKKAKPQMPRQAVMSGTSGEVSLFLTFTNGKISRCRPIVLDEKSKIFVDSAIEAALKSKYRIDERPGSDRIVITFSFNN